ncbi:MAG: hypothetical protein PHP45_09495 [Elusimicrobiales bacterium]|nr:hypothetical protein [Elusimicrobiales bacterium]
MNKCKLLSFILGTCLLSAGCASAETKNSRDISDITPSVCAVPVTLPASLEPQRREIEADFSKALVRSIRFAKENNLESYWKCFIDRAQIYDSKKDFDRAMLAASGENPDTQVPKTFSAVLENRVFMGVSPKLYAENCPKCVDTDYYEKIIAHEIAHRLHVSILGGKEDDMGPVWFYEGFAVYAARQFENSTLAMTPSEMLTVVDSPERGDYRSYLLVFKHLRTKASVPELVSKARKKDFMDWVHEQIH